MMLAEKAVISKAVAAQLSTMQHFSRIRHIEDMELTHVQYSRKLSVVAAWQCSGVCR